MIVNELFQPTPPAFKTDKQDHSTLTTKKTRTTRLSLSQLNRLRIMNDARKLEHEKKLENLTVQYKPVAPAGPGL